jgi:hypothetical protein
VANHFFSQDIVEMETLMLFAHVVKNNANKYDQKSAGAYP